MGFTPFYTAVQSSTCAVFFYPENMIGLQNLVCSYGTTRAYPSNTIDLDSFIKSLKKPTAQQKIVAKQKELVLQLEQDGKLAEAKEAKEVLRQEKDKLPCITPTGVFEQKFLKTNFKWETYTGFVQVDFDLHNSEKALKLKETLKNDKHILACFLSPTHTGVKALFRVPIVRSETEHAKNYDAVTAYFKNEYGQKIDTQCKNFNRVLFYSHDENLCYNPLCEVFDPTKKETEPEPVPIQKTDNKAFYLNEDEMFEIALDSVMKYFDCSEYNQWIRVGFSLTSWHNGRDVFHKISQARGGIYDFSKCDAKFDNLLKTPEPRESFFKLAYSIDSDLKNKRNKISQEKWGEAQSKKKQDASKQTKKEYPQPEGYIEFPFHVFPKGITDLIEEYSTKRDFSRVLLANSILCVFSGAVGMNYEYRLSNGWSGFANLYMALVGRASISKSPTMNFALSPIFEVEKLWNSNFKKGMGEYEATQKVSKKNNFAEPKPTRQRILLNDATIEAVIKLHSANEKGLLLFRDELIAWLRGFNGYKGGKGSDQQNYLSIWDNGVVLNDRAGREAEQFLPQSFVSVFGGIQPKVLAELAKDSRLDDGFILRFLFCFAEEKETPALWADICERTDAVLYTSYKEAVKYYALQTFNIEPVAMSFSKEAEKTWAEFYDNNRFDVKQKNNDDYSSLVTKLEKYTTRLALLLQLIHNVYNGDVYNTEITKECMLGALKLVDYYKETANKALNIIEETKDFDSVTTATVDWRKVFADNTELTTGEIVLQIATIFGKSERTAKALISKELTKVRYGIWKM